jgi:hypothetical protein
MPTSRTQFVYRRRRASAWWPTQFERIKPVFFHLAAAAALFIAAAVVMRFVRREVQARITFIDAPPMVMMKDRPPWMSDSLADQICAMAQPTDLHTAFDHDLLVRTAHSLAACPWVRQVRQVRRVYGQRPGDTLEIDCEYRAPVALVHWKDYFWLIDGQGFALPEQYTAAQVPRIVLDRDRHVNIRIIEGVEHAPVQAGMHWPGGDLAAGLDLARLLYGYPFADDAIKIDVSNYLGRLDDTEAQLTLITRYGTVIKWGRPLNAVDFFDEVSPRQKLDSLARIFQRYGRLDANHPWIDVRFDRVTYPTDDPASNDASQDAAAPDRPDPAPVMQ